MIATGGAMAFIRRLEGMGLEEQAAQVDVEALTERIESIKMRLQRGTTNLLTSQGVQLVHGSARMLSPHDVEVTETAADGTTSTRSIVADAVLIATGTRPRIPEWCQPDGEAARWRASISSTMRLAASRGSAAWVIGRPMTR